MFYTLKQVADILGVHYHKMRRLVAKGSMPSASFKIGNNWAYDLAAIETMRRWIEKEEFNKKQMAKLKQQIADKDREAKEWAEQMRVEIDQLKSLAPKLREQQQTEL